MSSPGLASPSFCSLFVHNDSVWPETAIAGRGAGGVASCYNRESERNMGVLSKFPQAAGRTVLFV